MRIAMLGQKRTFTRSGGVEVVVTELSRRMVALGHEVICYDRAEEGESEAPYEREGVRVIPVRTLKIRGLSALTSSFSATWAALRDRPDIIHYHAEGPCVPLILAKRAGVRTVATIHGLDWQRAKWGRFASAYIRRGERTAARSADALIVLSRAAQMYFLKKYGRESVVIPNGIGEVRSLPARTIADKWGLTEGSYILYLGRLVPEKRIELLIEAFRSINTDKRLIIAGGAADAAAYEHELRACARGDRRIVFTGFVSGDALDELYANAFLYVLPSDVEGLPMSLLEAMAHGRCCITSDIPECADVLAGTGVTFPKGDAHGLARALAALIADPARTEALGEAAREHVLAAYSWGAVVESTTALYEKILPSESSAAGSRGANAARVDVRNGGAL